MKTLRDQALSDTPQIIVGKIIGVVGPTLSTGGYLSGSVRYTIAASIPGVGVVEYARQLPEIRMWPDDMAIDSHRLLGSAVTGVMVAREIRWCFYEPPTMAGCTDAPGSVAMTITLPDGSVVTRMGGPDLPPIDGPPSDAPGIPPGSPTDDGGIT